MFIYVFISTSGIIAAILTLKLIFLSRQQTSSIRPSPVLLVPRDSHKSVFDALSLFEIDAVLLDVPQDTDWQISVGLQTETVRQAINQYGANVCSFVLFNRESYFKK